MVDGAFRDFARWGIAQQSGRFAQLNAITQLAKMTSLLLGPLSHERTWPALLEAAAKMNAWQVHEVFSDNLALGLCMPPAEDDEAMSGRRRLLRTFNRSIVGVLEEDEALDEAAIAELSRRLRPDGTAPSITQQTLCPDKYGALVDEFAATDERWTRDDVEADLTPILVANVLSCRDVARFVDHDEMRALVTDWLCHRYEAVDVFLGRPSLSRPELVEFGGRTILVVPTLAYYFYVMARVRGLADRLTPRVVQGPLQRALRSSAILVRLLNDLGSYLMLAGPEARQAETTRLERHLSRTGGRLIDALSSYDSPRITRLLKDARFREFNLALHGLAHLEASPSVAREFVERIDFFAELYRAHTHMVSSQLERVDEVLGTSECSMVIRVFIEFHERLYMNDYDSEDGEYAI